MFLLPCVILCGRVCSVNGKFCHAIRTCEKEVRRDGPTLYRLTFGPGVRGESVQVGKVVLYSAVVRPSCSTNRPAYGVIRIRTMSKIFAELII